MIPPSDSNCLSPALLNIDGLSFSYKKNKPVLRDVSFQLTSNKIVGIIGVNGAGKSTLISAIADYPRQNTISLMGASAMREPLVTAYDEPKLYSYLSGRHCIRYLLDLKGKRLPFPDEVVAGFQIEPRLDELIRDYSFGMKRKVYLTICLTEPAAFLQMDEPTNGLDALSIIFLKDYLRQLCQRGTGILLASHDIGFLESTCDRVYVLKDGMLCGSYEKGDERGLEQVYLELVRGP